ncbi:uncharacterized protein LOC134531126 isoform X2 [Bacillus rossius redtenbacheri]|uniref:uncharacterized protein LOC134531126 isoform X2 n=1 Tax=Bacillus rossius redtenbacheri TaxID=93214 RepID=UPI002FDEA7C6
MLQALPLLPHEKALEGYKVAKVFAETKNLMPTISTTLQYFENQWLKKVAAKSFSVFGQARCTNNAQESYHRHLMMVVGRPHPNVWHFTDSLRSISGSECRNIERIEQGMQVSRPRKLTWLLQDRCIKQAQEHVVSGRIPVFEFLSAIRHRVQIGHPEDLLGGADHDDLTELPGDIPEGLAQLPDNEPEELPQPNENMYGGDCLCIDYLSQPDNVPEDLPQTNANMDGDECQSPSQLGNFFFPCLYCDIDIGLVVDEFVTG